MDIIVKLNGKPAGGLESFRKHMSAFSAGEKVTIAGLRKGQPFTVEAVLAERPPDFHRAPPFPRPEMVPLPELRDSRGKIKLRFRGPDGKEHEHEFEIPYHGLLEEFEFDLPGLNLKDMRRELRELLEDQDFKGRLHHSLEEAKEQIEKFSEEMKKRHKDFQEKVRKGIERHVEARKPGTDSKSIVVQTRRAFVRSDDGEHEISIRTEDGKKTVTVKKGDKTLAEDLPFEKLDTLPEEIQEKVKKLDRNVEVEVEGFPEGKLEIEKPGKEKRIHRLPTKDV
jgi:hypothetical protein